MIRLARVPGAVRLVRSDASQSCVVPADTAIDVGRLASIRREGPVVVVEQRAPTGRRLVEWRWTMPTDDDADRAVGQLVRAAR